MAVIIQDGLVPTITLTGQPRRNPPPVPVITTSATEIKDIPVDTSDVADGKVLTYDAETATLVFTTPESGGGSGDSFDQDLNTIDDVQFSTVIVNEITTDILNVGAIDNLPSESITIHGDLSMVGHSIETAGAITASEIGSSTENPLALTSDINMQGHSIVMNTGEASGGTLNMFGGDIVNADAISGVNNVNASNFAGGQLNINIIATNSEAPITIQSEVNLENNLNVNSIDVNLSRFDTNGTFITRVNTAPDNGDLNNSEVAIWYDDDAGEIKFKGKKSNGVVVDAAPAGGGGGGGFEFDVNNNLDIGIDNDIGHISSLASVGFDFLNIEGISDGNTIILTNTEGSIFTYEFDNNSSVTEGNIAVTLVDSEGYDAAGTAASFYAVINGGSDFDITLDESGTSGVVTQITPGSNGNTSLDGDLSGSVFSSAFENGIDDSESQIALGFGLTSDFDTSIVIGITDTKITVFYEFQTIVMQADNGVNIANQLQIGNTNSESIIYQQAYLAQEDTGEVIWTYNLTPNGHSINLSSDTAYKISMSGIGGANGIQFHGNAANNNNWNANKVLLFNIKNTGQAISTGAIGTAATSAPDDSDISNNQLYFWWQDGTTVSFKGKDNGGGVHTGSLLTKNTDINMSTHNITNIDTISGTDENWEIPQSGNATFTGLMLTDLPTDDPGVAGVVWNDNGTLMISTGPGS